MHESGCWGDYCERRYSGANSHFQRGLSDEGRNRRKNRRVCCAGSFTTVRSAGCCGSFSGGRKWEGGKTEEGAHLWSQFSRMTRGTGKKQASPRGYARLSAALSHGSGGSRNFKKSGWSWSGPTEISKNTCICQSEKPCCNWQIWRTDWEGESL